MRFRSPAFLAASILFFFSGMLGLGYELVWIKKAALVVGASQIALSTVLTAFFLGLGLGSYTVGRFLRSRRWSPLLIYGLFEAAIGLFALAFPSLFRGLEAAYGALYPYFQGSAAGLFALRFLLLFALFLVPTFFMGGTLPLLLDGLVERDRSIGTFTSLLYGINICGAVCGVLVTSYFAIPRLGMNGASVAGGVANLAIGLLAMVLFARRAPLHALEEPAPLARFFPAAAFASGLLAIAYQVAWARYFSLFNTGTVYLTAILLAVYLLALAAGSFLLAPLLAARWNPLRVLGIAQALVPLAVPLTLEAWRLAEYRFALKGQLSEAGVPVALDTLEIDSAYRYFWQFASEGLDAIFFAPLFQVGLAIFLPVVLIGVGLPSIIAAAARTSAGLRSVSGRILFWNTLGSSAGGFLAGYVLLPLLGLHWTFLALGAGSAGLSLLALVQASGSRPVEEAPATRRERRQQARRGGEGAAADARPAFSPRHLAIPVLGLLPAVLIAGLREDITAYTVKYHGYGRDPDVGYSPDDRPDPGRKLMPLAALREGPLTTSFLFEDRASARIGSGNVCLAVAYKQSYSPQAIQGHLPCLFYPGRGTPENCLGICLGSGQSFGALLLYPIKSLDVVDISSEIVQLSLRHFAPYHHGLSTDPRVKIHLDDGRHFIERAGDGSYDVISMEPPPPTAEGVSSLYSLEFCREARRCLRDGGVFMQWLPLYRITPLDARAIVKTQAEVFPETFLVKTCAEDPMVMSYKTRPKFSIEAIGERIKVLAKEREVAGKRWGSGCRHDIASVDAVMSSILTGPEDIAAMPAPLIVRDDTQILSYSSGDRWLLRRYQGPALSPISFSALHLTGFAKLGGYFEPPLGAGTAVDLELERAAALESFHVPDPRWVAAQREALRNGRESATRARIALDLAAALDAMLDKDEAFDFLAQALEALEGAAAPGAAEDEAMARRIIRNRLAAFEEKTSSWIEEMGKKHGRSPLFKAMREELGAFKQRDSMRLNGYWFH
jgi:spermidine synthase